MLLLLAYVTVGRVGITKIFYKIVGTNILIMFSHKLTEASVFFFINTFAKGIPGKK
jgi:hypothetical protein